MIQLSALIPIILRVSHQYITTDYKCSPFFSFTTAALMPFPSDFLTSFLQETNVALSAMSSTSNKGTSTTMPPPPRPQRYDLTAYAHPEPAAEASMHSEHPRRLTPIPEKMVLRPQTPWC